jgi:hypothetical protein
VSRGRIIGVALLVARGDPRQAAVPPKQQIGDWRLAIDD